MQKITVLDLAKFSSDLDLEREVFGSKSTVLGRIVVSVSFRFSSIARAFKNLICSGII